MTNQLVFASATPPPSIKAQKKSKSVPLENSLYTSVELRHHLNVYYDNENYVKKREPSVQARLQLGHLFYNGALDIYGTFGVKKHTQTQQILQRRPRIQVDVYPVRSEYFVLRQYNLVKLPFEKNDSQTEIDDESSEDNLELKESGSEDGTTYIIGFEPNLRFKLSNMSNNFKFRLNTNVWTKLFSRRQYISDYEDEFDNELALTETQKEDEEDYA